MKKLSFIVPFVGVILMSCSTQQSKTKLNSLPSGSTIALKTSNGDVKVLGQTPLEVDTQILRANGELTSLIFSKEGYLDQQVAMILEKSDTSIDLTTKLVSKTEDVGQKVAAQNFEKLAQLMVKAHNLIGLKRYSEAENILMSLTRDFPSVSVSYDLLGNISYLQKDLTRALNFYERSIRINPENSETQRMIQKLKMNSI